SVQNRLCGQQPEAAQELHRVFTLARLPRPTAAIELRDNALQQHQLELRVLVTGPRRLARLLEPALDDCEIGERQLTGDDVVVAHGIDGSHDVHHIGILKSTDHVHHGVDFADVREELIAQPFALRGAFHESRDVDELDDRGNFFLWLDDGVELLEARVGHFDDADVRLYRAEGIIYRGSSLG